MEKAENLVGKEVLVEAGPDEEENETNPIIGFMLKDLTSGTTGSVVDVRPLNHHPLLIVDINGADVMIPFVDEMIVEVNDQEKTITMNLPEGLLDL